LSFNFLFGTENALSASGAAQTVVFEFFACLCEVVSISGVAARNARSKQKEKSGEARL